MLEPGQKSVKTMTTTSVTPTSSNAFSNPDNPKRLIRCAVYTRKSCEEGSKQEFTSLDAQRLAGENYIASQAHEGWICLPTQYNDGGFSGGNLERPALKQLFTDIRDGLIDCIVVYKIDRLSRSLMDFCSIIPLLNDHQVSFVSVTQSFNTSNAMGKLMLNILLSFAQYERELTSERIRDKFTASRKQGYWMGGTVPLGYDAKDKKLIINEEEANTVRLLYKQFLEAQSVIGVVRQINALGLRTKHRISKAGIVQGIFQKKHVLRILQNPVYAGKVSHKGKLYKGKHEAIIEEDTWQKVQSLFQHQERPQTIGKRMSTAPLLKGLLHCGDCNSAMVPVYTNKRHTRYRYYICESVHNGKQTDCKVRRISAGEIEQMAMKQIINLLKNPEVLVKAIQTDKAGRTKDEITQALQSIAGIWDDLFPAEQIRMVNLLMKSICIKPYGAEIDIYKTGFNRLIDEVRINP